MILYKWIIIYNVLQDSNSILRKNKKREFPNIKWEIPFAVKNKYCNFAAKSTIKK